MDVLLANLASAGLMVNDYIKLDALQRVAVANFRTLFGSTDGSYAALVAADDNGDGSTKGYHAFFESWHTAGII